jgi:hypothetical protein
MHQQVESRKYDGYKPVFKYGSCIDCRTGFAVFLPNKVAKTRLLDDTSIFNAELYAIHQALLRIQESTLHGLDENLPEIHFSIKSKTSLTIWHSSG